MVQKGIKPSRAGCPVKVIWSSLGFLVESRQSCCPVHDVFSVLTVWHAPRTNFKSFWPPQKVAEILCPYVLVMCVLHKIIVLGVNPKP